MPTALNSNCGGHRLSNYRRNGRLTDRQVDARATLGLFHRYPKNEVVVNRKLSTQLQVVHIDDCMSPNFHNVKWKPWLQALVSFQSFKSLSDAEFGAPIGSGFASTIYTADIPR